MPLIVDSNVILDLITRDTRRYATYFPTLTLIAP